MHKETKTKEKVKLSELGLYMRIVHMDYNPQSNEELAQLIEEHFNVICSEEDIKRYEELHREYEDYEKLSRMIEFGNLECHVE